MNDLGREKLVEAALKGVRQITGALTDNKGGFCAMGVLGFSSDMTLTTFYNAVRAYDLSTTIRSCDLCGLNVLGELKLIPHLNDGHGLDFLTIARKV